MVITGNNSGKIFFWLFVLDSVSHYVAEAGLELLKLQILPSQSHKCWDYRNTSTPSSIVAKSLVKVDTGKI
jgi:hypothetical protein